MSKGRKYAPLRLGADVLALTGDEYASVALVVFFFGIAATVGIASVVAMVILLPRMISGAHRYAQREISGPEITGPALTATARLLSMQTTGTEIGIRGQDYYICIIGLRVEIPGRQPYDVTIRQGVHLLSIAPLQSGAAIPVQVDSTNPQNVRIDFSRQMMPIAADAFNRSPGSVQVGSPAALLATGQRVPGVLKLFTATGSTPRSLGATPSRPELVDAPLYSLVVELQFPNGAPVQGQTIQPVPLAQVPNLVSGLKLPCVADPANPAQQFLVDWDRIAN